MSVELQPYQPIRELAERLWVVDGEWYGTAFKRRMTIAGLAGGELVLHSPIRMRDEDLAALDRLGRVSAVVVPNAFHGDEASYYAERYPSARVLVPAALEGKIRRKHRVDGSLGSDLAPELRVVALEGTRMHEAVLLHVPSRTLVLTDLAFNHREEDFKPGLERFFMRTNRIGQGFGPSWLFRHLFTKNRAALSRSLARVAKWDFDRIVVSHGAIIESGGKAEFRRAFGEDLLGVR